MGKMCRSFLLFLLISLFVSFGFAEIRFTKIRSNDRPIIPFDEFWFTHNGRLELNVSQITLSDNNPNLNFNNVGFFLCTRDAWLHVLQQLADAKISCVLHSSLVKIVSNLKTLNGKSSFNSVLPVKNADRYTLLFANCLSQVKVSMTVRSAMYNLEGNQNHRDYLSADETFLPKLYFLLSLVYFTLAGIWIYVLYKKRLTVFRIHFFMLIVVVLKALSLVSKAEDTLYIQQTGTAHSWDVPFYIFSSLKGIMLFTLIILIGTGWSLLKPYLQDKEKMVLTIVIPLQVVANIALVIIDETSPFSPYRVTWKSLFLLVDIICCCTMLLQIVWSIKNLREAAQTDGKAAVNLKKLTLFKQYYVMVICYIYLTLVGVYGLETITWGKYPWSSVLVGELATLVFYVFTGYKFKPETYNPYFTIDDEEEEEEADDVEQLKLHDEEKIGQ
ncbi:hypothetical protein Goshw_014454 [Gossypium schwendimanii]|uniref:Uncharacterized protein n=1 Tax=Gossypium schwendimanii TaxID=34291 RepID=A0A7J9LMW3_GOSSC|nr:hypothetical protein [Gossypium schwendimanii]